MNKSLRSLLVTTSPWCRQAVLLMATAGLIPAAMGQTVTFAPVATFSTGAGTGPLRTAVADVNGDGKLDVLTANYNTRTIGVLLGNGNGGFTQQANSLYLGEYSGPQSVVVADVNGDGKPDALVGNFLNSTLGVLLGNGNGGFTLASSPSTGRDSEPQSVAVADVNGDGKLDVLTANYTTSTLGVLLGDGKGGFTLQSGSPSTGASSAPQSVAVADVNGDGKPDALTANAITNTLGVLLNTTVYAAPTLTSLSLTSGMGGSRVTLTGTNLGSTMGVSFNGTAATFSVVNTTTVTTTVPTGASTGNVTVTTPGGTSNGLPFTVTPTLATTPGLSAIEVRVYPNPAQSGFTVVVPAVAAAGRVQAELCNSLGQLVHQQSAPLPAAGARLTVPTAGLAAGVYVLRLQAGTTFLTQRVVVR